MRSALHQCGIHCNPSAALFSNLNGASGDDKAQLPLLIWEDTAGIESNYIATLSRHYSLKSYVTCLA